MGTPRKAVREPNPGRCSPSRFRSPKPSNTPSASNGSSQTHCPGAGHADPGYLCVYVANKSNTDQIHNFNIYNPETADGGNNTAGAHGFSIYLAATTIGAWSIKGTYAVTAPAR